ncbi:unannotated protein [freshwater metagenome]|uniref:Unannotated protein n=1 Tax=freshwater metagenome TaxID=449393 RepID=A0A6J7IHG2_9ZZZZ|nr:hypothetical protein [Actinomycetota bacterium]
MIAFGTAIGDPRAYRRHAEPGIAAVAEPQSPVITFMDAGGPGRTLNLILDEARRIADLEALVLVEDHTEITDPAFCARVRELVADPQLAIAGCIGGSNFRGIAWWTGTVRGTPVRQRHHDAGGGERLAFDWGPPPGPPGEVEAVDGLLLVLSPWAVEHLRFDESLPSRYGVAIDLCRRARAAGRTVFAARLDVLTHRPLEPLQPEDQPEWVQAHIAAADRREDAGDPDSAAWKERARHAEARREASRLHYYSTDLRYDAQRLRMLRRVQWLPLGRLHSLARRARDAARDL